MAYNAASHNLTGEPTGPVTGQPPSLSNETTSALIGSSECDPMGQNAPGRDGGDKNEGKKVKSEKELEKERQKAEKAKRFAEKQAKMQKTAAAPSKKEKKKVESKEEVLPEYKDETPKGQKKILKSLDDPYNKAYNPKVVESAWYDWWEAEGFFKPEFAPNGEVKESGYFVIPIPPPNVTGSLHIGHALATTLQDTLIRWNRMKGLTTLFVPGCDHAGIATQTVVEKRLKREGKTRHDLGRSAFIQRVQEWKGEYHARITNSLKRMGGSFDWTREAFTMDENLSKAVMQTFIQLHEEGYIYRANKLVNWCTQLSTSISNLEVDEKELKGRTLLDVPGYERKVEFGILTHFKYPIDGSEETIEVATTRVETMLGDSGIAVHPTDKRYQHLIGKFAHHPFLDRLLPIFADEYVDPEFGTGCVKITPAHDPNDFALGKKHNLEFINIFTDDGFINKNGGKFEGQKRFDVRYTLTKELTDLGLFVKKEDNPMKIPICSRTKDVIEPRLKPQWWMRMPELADAAMKAVRDGSIKIRPEQSEKDYFRWMETIQDWCLSRQLWWGHQIPAYFVKVEGVALDDADNEYWITAKSEEEAHEKAAQKFPGKNFTLERDPDCLDTWFSSGLWPFSTLGWPSETHDFKKFFPTSVLETGWDILFFWVARMIMLSLKLTGKPPFTEVYCHSLVRDSENRKMSKSLGNVIDPIDVMEGIQLESLHQKLLEGNMDSKEVANATKYQKTAFPQGIPECGADALRFSLVNYTTGGGDIAFDIKTMHAYRRFCNKIYQATKYVLGNLAADFTPQGKGGKTGKESLPERWILHKLNIATRDINKALTAREFSRSTQTAYRYWYDELCDVYIENSKAIIQNGTKEEKRSAVDTLYTALEGALLLIHPFMPFLSEELWQRLPRRPGDSTPSIMVATYPQYDLELEDPTSEAAYELILGCSKGIRSLIAEYGNKDEGKAFVKTFDDTSFETANREVQSIQSLSKAPGKGAVTIKVLSKDESTPTGCAVFNVSSSAAAYLEVKGRIDIETEIKKAQGKMKKAADSAVKQRKLLDELADKAGDAVIEVEKQRLTEFLAEQRNYEQSIEQFEQLKLEEKK